jgi:hypothetical protein
MSRRAKTFLYRNEHIETVAHAAAADGRRRAACLQARERVAVSTTEQTPRNEACNTCRNQIRNLRRAVSDFQIQVGGLAGAFGRR